MLASSSFAVTELTSPPAALTVSALAETVSAAGGDVSLVTAKLEEASTLLAPSQATEAEAEASFAAVPQATDRRAAFAEARSRARTAIGTLQQSRASLRNALLDLRAVINGLKGAAG